MFHVCSSNPFREKGFWFKGNLHTHTTNSDGALSPEQTIRLYKKNGYDFLSITEHEVVTDIKQLSEVFKDDFFVDPRSGARCWKIGNSNKIPYCSSQLGAYDRNR